MAKISRRKINLAAHGSGDDFRKFASASLIYAAIAIYLYHPYFNRFSLLQFFRLLNLCVAGLGAYTLSRRWVFSFWPLFLTGLLYSFSPLMLRINSFHPAAGLMAAIVPWLFYPAAFWPDRRGQWLNRLLCILPFLAVVTFFAVTTHFHLFLMPKQIKLSAIDLLRILAVTARVNGGPATIGFYHIAIAPLIMGFAMFLAAKRYGFFFILSAALALAISNSVLNITPLMWATIPVLGCAVIIGEGIQGLVESGFSDRKWVLTITVFLMGLSVVMMILSAKFSPAFSQSAKMYMLGAIVTGTIYFTLRAKMRLKGVRMLILCLAMGVDIFFGAKFFTAMFF